MSADTVVLIITLIGAVIALLIVWLNYKKDKTDNPNASKILGKRIAWLVAVGIVINMIIPTINHFKPKPPPAATLEDVRQIVAEYIGEKPKNPPAKEVENKLEKKLRAAFEQQKKKALELYNRGNSAYDNNQFKAAISHFEASLEIVEISSFYLSLGNC